MVHSFLVYLQLSVGSYLNLWKDLSKKGYNTANLKELSDWLILTGSLSLVGLFVDIIFLNQRINRHIDDLEDL